MKCLQPNGYHVFVQSRVRCLRAVALAVGLWKSSLVTSPSWRSATVELSQFLTQASSSRGRPTWFQERHDTLCVWNREHLEDFSVSSTVIGVSADVCICSACFGGGVSLETDKLPEHLQVHRCQVACAPLGCAGRCFREVKFGRG